MPSASLNTPWKLKRWTLASLVLSASPLLLASSADADVDAVELETDGAGTATSQLIKRLVQKGVLPADESADLIMLAEADAAELRAQRALAQAALAQAAAAKARARALAIQLARQQAGGGAAAIAQGPAPQPTTPVRRVPAEEVRPLPPAPREVAVVPVEAPTSAPEATRSRVEPRRSVVELDEPLVENSRVVAPASSAAGSWDNSMGVPAPVVRRPNRATASVEVLPAPLPVVTPTEVKEAPPVEPPAPVAAAQAEDAPPEIHEEAEAASEAETLAEAEHAPADEVRVRYVPENVRRQIKAELKQEVMAQAREEGWATPRKFPSWIDRLSFYGDFRFRLEGSFMPKENAVGQSSSFWNFNAINSSATPYDITGDSLPPYVNNNEDRLRVRIRGRLGLNADLSEGFNAGLRIATGESNSPVSQNQTLGGSGGNFSKFALWLDRAFLRYELGGLPDENTQVTVGRFERPYQGTSMVWSDDLGFDGLAFQMRHGFGESLVPFVTLGAHPVFNTDLNFGTTNYIKSKSRDKWLLGSQLGTDFDVTADVTAKVSVGYYHYINVEGEVSPSVLPLAATDSFDADASRPSFAQRGNTYIALRNIKADQAVNGNGTTKQWQYFGLATPFHELATNLEFNIDAWEPYRLTIFGEYVRNLAFDRKEVLAAGPSNFLGPVNNNASVTSATGTTTEVYGGSPTAWNAGVRFGRAALEKRWDWNASIAYRDVGSDSVVDAFADSDFGGGGTNQKGFVLAGNLALSRSVNLGLKWMSADQKAGGSPIKNDTLQLDLNGKF